jgi:hypothetical protein
VDEFIVNNELICVFIGLFHPEHGDVTFFQNTGNHPHVHMGSQPRRPEHTFSPSLKLQISSTWNCLMFVLLIIFVNSGIFDHELSQFSTCVICLLASLECICKGIKWLSKPLKVSISGTLCMLLLLTLVCFRNVPIFQREQELVLGYVYNFNNRTSANLTY